MLLPKLRGTKTLVNTVPGFDLLKLGPSPNHTFLDHRTFCCTPFSLVLSLVFSLVLSPSSPNLQHESDNPRGDGSRCRGPGESVGAPLVTAGICRYLGYEEEGENQEAPF